MVTDKGRKYFTFLGRDAIEHLKLYLEYRQKLTGKPIAAKDYIFINDMYASEIETGKPLTKDSVEKQILRALTTKGVIKRDGSARWRSEFHPHALRHLFKTECAHVGINPVISEFWMGHDKGIEYAYNHQHELHPEDFVQTYKKVEPYLSISTPSDYADQQERIQDLEQRLMTLEAIYSERLRIR